VQVHNVEKEAASLVSHDHQSDTHRPGNTQTVVHKSLEPCEILTTDQPLATRGASKSWHFPDGAKRPVKRTLSCPPGCALSTSVGPWSLEWVNRHKSDGTGVVHPVVIKGQ
jgi:hypothetical protein